jgi:hypothetical protein
MSPEPQHPGNPTEGQGGIVVHWEKVSKTKTLVKARFNGTLVHSHALDLNSATARASYAQTLVAKVQAAHQVEVNANVIEQQLIAAIDEMAAQVVGDDDGSAGPPEYLALDDDEDPERRGLYRLTADMPHQLSNFTMFIDRDTVIRDGPEERHQFEGIIRLHGKVAKFSISSEVFASNEQLRAAIFAAAGPKATILCKVDALRTAISRVSAPVARTVTTDIGWNETGDAYLVSGGWIDAAGFHPAGEGDAVRVDLGDEEGACWLGMTPLEPARLIKVKQHIVADLMRLHERPVMYTLLAAAALAVLDRFSGSTQRLAVWLKGLTGAGKSFAAKLAMNFFGDFDLRDGTRFANWGSTAFYVQRQGYFYKDSLYLIDDYKPEVIAQRDAVYVLQNYGDGTGRGRLRKDATTNITRPIRGLLLSTGEDLPQNNASALARTVIVAVPQAEKDLKRGARCLAECPRYSALMADFIQWLLAEGRTQQFAARVEQYGAAYYKRIAGQQNDARIASNFARLAAAFAEFARYLADAWPTCHLEAQRFSGTILVQALDEMSEIVKCQQASAIFLETLGNLLEHGKVRAVKWYGDCESPEELKNRPRVGKFEAAKPLPYAGYGKPKPAYQNGDIFAINLPLALEAVQESLRRRARPELRVTEQTLLAQLVEDGKLVDADGKKITPATPKKTKAVRIEGASLRAVRIPAEFLISEKPTPEDAQPGGAQPGAETPYDPDAGEEDES